MSKTLTYTDTDGDTLTVHLFSDGKPVLTTPAAGVELSHEQVLDLFRKLGAYLEGDPAKPCEAGCIAEGDHRATGCLTLPDPGRAARAEAMLSAAETIKATSGTVEIGGVKIAACDEYGRTAADLEAPTCCNGEDSSPCCPTVVPSILEEAHAAVYGDRQDDYGHPREDFTRTAIIWTGLLQHKLADGEYIDAEDVPRCMIGVKLARDVNAPKRDNRVDGAGYFLTLDRLETGR